jgi:hypothetical protein
MAWMWGAAKVGVAFVVLSASSAGMDGTGALFAFANVMALGFGNTKSCP